MSQTTNDIISNIKSILDIMATSMMPFLDYVSMFLGFVIIFIGLIRLTRHGKAQQMFRYV